jgi:hypothetical protein
MKLKTMFVVAAAVLVFTAASVNLHAASVNLAIMGSSASYQEAGQASYVENGCIFINSTKGFNIVDSRTDSTNSANSVSTTDTAAAWVTWKPSGGSCANWDGAQDINFFMNTDSVLGNRCFFASPSCVVNTNGSFSAVCGTALPGTTCTNLPAAVQTAINNNNGTTGSGTSINVAATDIRPEDALFATLRAITPCNLTVGGSTNYIGLGLQTPNANVATTIAGATWTINNGYALPGGTFHVNNFAIQGTDPATHAAIANGTGNGWVVQSLGATPILVIVSPRNVNGLGSLAINNINKSTLAGYLDGTYGTTTDMVPQAFVAPTVPVNVMIREAVSGTYNTMEYNIPNSVELQTSQDIGLAAVHTGNAASGTANEPYSGPYPLTYCVGSTVGYTPDPGYGSAVSGSTWGSGSPYNPLQEQDARAVAGNSTRSRAIGTGNMVAAVEGTTDSLGYAFWSQSNFSSATPGTLKYLSVDGVDPIQEVYSNGEIPTIKDDLIGNVTLSHVKDGSYPIWSNLRMVSAAAQQASLAQLLADAQSFVTPNYPDFVLVSQMQTVRSHFTPPGVSYPGGSPANGDPGATAEAGGDVGGLPYSYQADGQFNTDNGVSTGQVGRRQ